MDPHVPAAIAALKVAASLLPPPSLGICALKTRLLSSHGRFRTMLVGWAEHQVSVSNDDGDGEDHHGTGVGSESLILAPMVFLARSCMMGSATVISLPTSGAHTQRVQGY